MSSADTEEEKARLVARDFAWKHFDLHAKQRIEVFKSYLTLIALIFAGHGVALQTKNYFVGVSLCFFQGAISVLFHQLDGRTKELIKLSEAFWQSEEQILADVLKTEKIRIFAESDRLALRQKTYGKIFTQFFYLCGGIATVFFVVYLILWHKSQQ